MYLSRLSCSIQPGHTHTGAAAHGKLAELVRQSGGDNTRMLLTSYASLGAPDLRFEQEAESLATLDAGMAAAMALLEFHRWSSEVTPALLDSPRRELFRVAGQRVGPARQDEHIVNGDPCPRDMVELVFY